MVRITSFHHIRFTGCIVSEQMAIVAPTTAQLSFAARRFWSHHGSVVGRYFMAVVRIRHQISVASDAVRIRQIDCSVMRRRFATARKMATQTTLLSGMFPQVDMASQTVIFIQFVEYRVRCPDRLIHRRCGYGGKAAGCQHQRSSQKYTSACYPTHPSPHASPHCSFGRRTPHGHHSPWTASARFSFSSRALPIKIYGSILD